jgi:hypothetical protein
MFTAIRRASSLVSNFGRSPPWLILEIDIRQLLPGIVHHDKAGFPVHRLTTAAGSGGRAWNEILAV